AELRFRGPGAAGAPDRRRSEPPLNGRDCRESVTVRRECAGVGPAGVAGGPHDLAGFPDVCSPNSAASPRTRRQAAKITWKPFGNPVEPEAIKTLTWPDASLIMTCGTGSQRLHDHEGRLESKHTPG